MQNCFFYYQVIIFVDKGFYCQMMGRGGGDNGEIVYIVYCYIQCLWDWCCCECQNIDIGVYCFNLFFVVYVEMVFFIDNQQVEVVQFYIVLQQFMCIDQNIDFIFGGFCQDLCLFFGVVKVGQYFNVYWLVGEMVVEVVIVLLCQQCGWYQYCYLFMVFYCQECGVYCYFGFVEVDVVVYQFVYCQWLVYIV